MEEGESQYWRDTWIPECRCPHCGIVVNGAGNLNGYTPKPGDPTICIECFEISQFTTDLTLEPITDENLLASSLVEIQKIRRFLIVFREQQ